MELLVVAAGVLLALSVQQWAEDRASLRRASEAEARIRQELLTASIDVAERMAVHGCLKQRLILLAEGLTRGGSDWRPTALPELFAGRLAFDRVYRVPSRNWPTATYGSAGSGGDLDSLPPERAARLSIAYGWLASIARQNAEEVQLAAGLSALQFPVVRRATERNAVLLDIVRLDQINSSLSVNAEQLLAHMRRIGIRPTDTEAGQAQRSGFLRTWISEGRVKYGRCFDTRAITALPGFAPRHKPQIR